MPFRVAISGLRAAQNELNVIGNNVANVGTTGFKGARAEFQDVFATSSLGASGGAGQGVNTGRIAQQFTQGNITFTDNGLDMAISGQGFFILEDGGARVYAREGAFGLDREGYVVNANEQRMLAYAADANGTISGALDSLRIDTSNTPPQQTSAITLGANLNSQEVPPTATVIDRNVANTFNRTTATTVFDSLGGAHTLQFYFAKDATPANTWRVDTYLDGETTPRLQSTIDFTPSGALANPAGGALTVPTINLPGLEPLDFNVDISAMTQFGAPFGVDQLVQDGFSTGRLAGLDIDSEGVVFARFTNGQSLVQGQVALANFPNPQGLQPLGKNNWAGTFAAGDVLEGAPGSASLGLIQAGALEDSNVDLSEQLVKLIVAQRNFQANTEVISTADAVTQAVINIR